MDTYLFTLISWNQFKHVGGKMSELERNMYKLQSTNVGTTIQNSVRSSSIIEVSAAVFINLLENMETISRS